MSGSRITAPDYCAVIVAEHELTSITCNLDTFIKAQSRMDGNLAGLSFLTGVSGLSGDMDGLFGPDASGLSDQPCR